MENGRKQNFSLMKWDKSNYFFRFIVGGVINTVFGYSVYLLFYLFLPYSAAYILSFVLGVVFSYVMNSKFVFHEPMSLKKFISFPLVYLVQLLTGYILLYMFVEFFGVYESIAPLFVTVINIPITYSLSRLIIKGGKK